MDYIVEEAVIMLQVLTHTKTNNCGLYQIEVVDTSKGQLVYLKDKKIGAEYCIDTYKKQISKIQKTAEQGIVKYICQSDIDTFLYNLLKYLIQQGGKTNE